MRVVCYVLSVHASNKIVMLNIFCNIGATYGTGITAIKLTALGRPQLLVNKMILLDY